MTRCPADCEGLTTLAEDHVVSWCLTFLWSQPKAGRRVVEPDHIPLAPSHGLNSEGISIQPRQRSHIIIPSWWATENFMEWPFLYSRIPNKIDRCRSSWKSSLLHKRRHPSTTCGNHDAQCSRGRRAEFPWQTFWRSTDFLWTCTNGWGM